MNNRLDETPRGARPHVRSLLLAGGTTLLLAACNSLTGVNDLNVSATNVGPGGAGTGGTGGTGGAGGDITGGGGAVVGGAGGGTGMGGPGAACAAADTCTAGLDCVFGACRAPCQEDTDPACTGTSCLTDANGKGGCRTEQDACPNGEAKGGLVCGPDKVLRMPCGEGKSCRNGQTCISGTCIGGTNEPSTPWGKCGAQGKTCANIELTVCDVGVPGKRTDKCATAAICSASVPGDAQGCVACEKAEAKCSVDATTKEIAGSLCNNGQTGFDVVVCGKDNGKGVIAPPQCNPSLGICQKIAVDANEVTQAEYAKFITDKTGETGKITGDADIPPACVGNDLRPTPTCLAQAAPNGICEYGSKGCEKHPVVCVDWCDAFTYCKYQGKKLCGKIGGGFKDNLPLGDFADPGKSEWSNACTAGGRFVYATDTDENYTPLGPLSIGQQCNGKDKGQVGDPPKRLTLPVDDPGLTFCKHQTQGYGALNLLGNVREWEASCAVPAFDPNAKLADACRVRGGSFRTNDDDDAKTALTSTAMRCDYDEKELRGNSYPDVGFRCCDL